jgi:putative ABC transport system permease protein
MLGMVIGVAAVVAMLTLGNAATESVTSGIAALGTNLLIVSPGSQRRGGAETSATPFDAADVRAMQREVGAEADVAPIASRSVLAVAGNANHPTNAIGTTAAYLTVRGYKIAEGRAFGEPEEQGARPVCLIGETVRKDLFGGSPGLSTTIRVGTLPCTVIGVLAEKGGSGMGGDQDDVVLVPLSTFQRRIEGSDAVGIVFIGVHEDRRIQAVRDRLTALLRERRHVAVGQPDDFSVQDMREIAAQFATATYVLTAFLGAIGGVSLLVGGIGIMNIMLVSVTERTREIGIRLAIGATPGDVLWQFLVEAIVLCTLGGSVGIVLGLGGSWLATWGLSLTFSVDPRVVVGAFVFCAGVGVVFGFLPARRAARLDPIEALRHE